MLPLDETSCAFWLPQTSFQHTGRFSFTGKSGGMFAVLKRAWARGGVSLNPRSARDGKKGRGALEISGGLRTIRGSRLSFHPPEGWLEEGENLPLVKEGNPSRYIIGGGAKLFPYNQVLIHFQ